MELWRRLDGSDEPDKIDEILLAPGRTPKNLRYYQDIAINQAVAGILEGKQRLLLTLATGTGKTLIAAQIAYKLWNMRWTRKGIGGRRPKILFLADRNFLVDEPYSKDFAIFGKARHKIQRVVNTSRDMFFAIYQAVDDREWTPGLYCQYPADFFDLIIVDECHWAHRPGRAAVVVPNGTLFGDGVAAEKMDTLLAPIEITGCSRLQQITHRSARPQLIAPYIALEKEKPPTGGG